MLPLLAALLITTAHASDYQQCTTSSTCTIGEYLYDDDYTPLTGASCTLTSKYPDGTTYLSSVVMTGSGDGWYKYDASIGTTEGLYHSNICCTPASGTLCIDKTFEVKAPSGSSLTPAAIWGYSDRTLTGYGTLVNDIWSASTRSLTTFGSLVGDVWGYSGRTLTSFGSLVESIWGATPSTLTAASASPTNLTGIVAEQRAQRELLEKLVNAPIISLSLDEDSNTPDLQTKLDESKQRAGSLYTNLTTAKSRLLALDAKWPRLTQDVASQEITEISSLFQNNDSVTHLTKSWDTPVIDELNQNLSILKTDFSSLLTATSLSKSSLAPLSLTTTLTTLSDLENVLGDTTSVSSDDTIYGYLAGVSERYSTLGIEKQKIAAVLENLNGQGTSVAERSVGQIKNRLLALNQYPGGASLVSPAKSSSDAKLNLKNILYSLQALVGLNQQLLAVNAGDPVRSLWLEEGSIIFRAVITNPSSIISQSVPLKFYLPRELKTEDILDLDPSLDTTYDSAEEALYVSGTYELKPLATQVVYVEVEDIWQLTDSEIQSLRNQASDLLRPLEKTAYFSQGTTLKSDIEVTLDKVVLATSKAVTPENKIRAYREAKLELTKVSSNMNRLQDLVAQSSGTGSIFGFVGGVQTMAVWGIILVVLAGFIFLSLYFKKLGISAPQSQTIVPPPLSLESKPTPSWQLPAIIATVVVVTAGSTILLTQLAKPKPAPVINQVIVGSPVATPSPKADPPREDTPIEIKNEKSVLGTGSVNETTTPSHTLTVPEDSSVNLRNRPSSDADIIMAIKESVEIYVFKEDGDWRQIGFTPADSTKGYWVHSKFIEEK